MLKLRSVFGLLCFVLLCSLAALVAGQKSTNRASKWPTLSGKEPLVIARGGFSGLFPDSSRMAYTWAVQTGLPDLLLWCDVQLTKDGVGICAPDIMLQNSSNIDTVYPDSRTSYVVNGVPMQGWFSVDFSFNDLQDQDVYLKQRIYSRAPNFDGSSQSFLPVEDVFMPPQGPEQQPQPLPAGLWLSIPHDAFFSQHSLSMRSYVLSLSGRNVSVSYISSPEVGFLRSIRNRMRPTKRVFQFLEPDAVEPTTNQTYGSLLNNLTLIKTFAAGILVPKTYICPVDDSQYLLNCTSLVVDAHLAGLEVFASGFANDGDMPYDYRSDPVSEYLSFIDNGRFSVDGVVSDFPVTPSATIAFVLLEFGLRVTRPAYSCYSQCIRVTRIRPSCYSQCIRVTRSSFVLLARHIRVTRPAYSCYPDDNLPSILYIFIAFLTWEEMTRFKTNISIISNEGASGDYPGCTDIAYVKAVSDGADILDCNVQMTSDGVLFCLGSINLRDRTNVAQSDFSNRSTSNQELNTQDGIFAFNLTWSEIQTLRPAMYNPYGGNFSLFRNPRARNDGKFMQLSDFLAFANNQSSVSGVLITIENAAYLAENQGLGVTDAVLSALNETGRNQTTKKIMIRSSDSSVLKEFESTDSYELVYLVDEDVRDILDSAILEIKSFASSVVVSKRSVYPTDQAFVTGETDVVSKLKKQGLKVYVQFFRNEYPSQPWDYYSDPYLEINACVTYKEIDGVITDYPATAERYRMNRCLSYTTTPVYMSPGQPGGLISLMVPKSYPPAEAPIPILVDSNVTEPPLPPVVERPPPGNTPTAPGPTTPPSGHPKLVASTMLGGIATLILVTFVLC
ncbi:hypothetical protein OROMI_023388 [Orobanche minor]